MDFHIAILVLLVDNHSLVLLLRCPDIEDAPFTRNRTTTTFLYSFIKISDIRYQIPLVGSYLQSLNPTAEIV